jgi:hypothetical protein
MIQYPYRDFFSWEICVKRTLRLFFSTVTAVLFLNAQPSLALQSSAQTTAQAAQPQATNPASSHDRHHRHHNSAKHRRHHHSTPSKH